VPFEQLAGFLDDDFFLAEHGVHLQDHSFVADTQDERWPTSAARGVAKVVVEPPQPGIRAVEEHASLAPGGDDVE